MSERDDARVAHLATDEDARNKGVVEALLIAADDPLGVSRLSSVLGRHTGAKEIRAYVDDLNEEYAQTGRSFRVVEVAGGFSVGCTQRICALDSATDARESRAPAFSSFPGNARYSGF